MGFHVHKTYHKDWSKIRCESTVLSLLKKYPIKGVLANNSQMAEGAIRAVRRMNRLATGFFIAGADGSTPSCRNIRSGQQQLDVLKPISTLMTEVMNLAKEYFESGKVSRKKVKIR